MIAHGRIAEIASGKAGLSSAKTAYYRQQFEFLGIEIPPLDVVKHIRQQQRLAREKVGTALATIIEGFLFVKGTQSCGCTKLAGQMDSWGIAGCERHREQIVTALASNRKVLEAALQASGETWKAKAVHFAPEAVLRAGAGWLLDRALQHVRDNPEPQTRPRTAAKRIEQSGRAPRPARTRRSGIRGAFTAGTGPARFVKSSQFQQDILSLIAKIPPDITAIAGVARSGLSAATMLSMYLHLPMITIRQTMGDIVDTGNGWRLGGSKHINPKHGKILVVDDTVMTGNSLKAIRPLIQSQVGNAVYAAVYVNPKALQKPDIWAVDLPWPHILEWNVFNSILSPSVAMDFDGILCRDCPAGSDDDGPKYLDFISHASPLYVPRRCPIPLIVTARIEKYRAETEAWLKRYGIRWHQLVMHPAATLRERQQDNIPAYKARHFAAWAANHRPAPGPIMFMESEDRQAREIARHSRLMVVCPHTAGVY